MAIKWSQYINSEMHPKYMLNIDPAEMTKKLSQSMIE